jgi:hypothetical protein
VAVELIARTGTLMETPHKPSAVTPDTSIPKVNVCAASSDVAIVAPLMVHATVPVTAESGAIVIGAAEIFPVVKAACKITALLWGIVTPYVAVIVPE